MNTLSLPGLQNPPNMTESNLNLLQSTQNSALRIITGCTADTNIEHLHTEAKILPLSNHLKLHASQLRQKSQLRTHPLHNLLPQPAGLREKKKTIFDNWSGTTITIKNDNNNTSTTELITQNLKTIHTIAVDECIRSYKPNSILAQPAPNINPSEQSLPCGMRRVLAQLRAGKSPILYSYLHMIDSKFHPSPLCPLCKSHDHTTSHLFSCQKINTTLNVRDLWDDLSRLRCCCSSGRMPRGQPEEALGSSLT